MKLRWTKFGDIPHGFLCETPVHLVYRVRDAAPVGALRRLSEDRKLALREARLEEATDEAVIERLLAEHFRAYDDLLDAQDQSRYVLQRAGAAEAVIASWQTLHAREELTLYAVCVMGNHVHVLLKGRDGQPEASLGNVVGRHKSYTNHLIRTATQHPTKIWDEGFYDRYVRPGTFWRVLWYILQNPAKAGLVGDWHDWAGTYVDERCLPGLEALR